MINTEFLGQMIDSMDSAVLQLEQSIKKKELDKANKLRTFIFDLHCQIDKAIKNKDV